MTLNHTPGPWTVSAGPDANRTGHYRNVYGADGKMLVAMLGLSARVGQTQQNANARLIAAAPELLAALQYWLRAIDSMTTEEFSRGADKPCRDRAAAAIAKALGE